MTTVSGMEASEDNRVMPASRLRIWLRRGFAVLLLAAVAAVAWYAFVREGEGDEPEQRKRAEGVSRKADEAVRGLDVEEQADQVLLLGFDDSDASAPIVAELRDRQLGGVLVGPQNGASPELLKALAKAGGENGRIPPLIAAAQEGGIYRSFGELPPVERQIDIGDRADPERAQAWAADAARALAGLGFTLNLFPVADVGTLDSPVGGRAFSDDAVLAAELTAAALRGCEEAEIACAPLHFPGLGAASQDTAEGPATVSLDAASLEARDLEPFRAAIAEKAPALVVSVALYSAYDAVTPAALAPQVVNDLLRDRLRFKGLAITDDLSSGAVKATHRVPEAAVAALRAGADLLQISSPDDQARVHNAIVAAVESGELPAERLAEAASRVLELKRGLGLEGG
jgi:beta-N-acetylhexosaminidase